MLLQGVGYRFCGSSSIISKKYSAFYALPFMLILWDKVFETHEVQVIHGVVLVNVVPLK